MAAAISTSSPPVAISASPRLQNPASRDPAQMAKLKLRILAQGGRRLPHPSKTAKGGAAVASTKCERWASLPPASARSTEGWATHQDQFLTKM